MILHYHDHGWGPQWPIKHIEQEMVTRYLAPIVASDLRVVLINSTWYGQDKHDQTLDWLRNRSWDALVLISMIDAPIFDAGWFREFDRPVIEIGSYPGSHHLCLWAEVVARHMFSYPDHDIDLPFMCLNRKPHWHRQRLYQQMQAANILEQGLVSFGGGQNSPALRVLAENVGSNDLAPNGGREQHGIPNDIVSLGDLHNWRRHFLNIVTETVFDVDDKYFVSEKIFKPIIGSRPFLVYARGGAARWLQDQGFQTYLDDFRDITDLDLSDADNIVSFLCALSDQGRSYWQKKYLDLLPKIRYNLNQFDQFVSEQRNLIQQGIPCPI